MRGRALEPVRLEAVGGVIQIFTRRDRGAFAPRFRVGIGSNHLREASAGIGGHRAAADITFARYSVGWKRQHRGSVWIADPVRRLSAPPAMSMRSICSRPEYLGDTDRDLEPFTAPSTNITLVEDGTARLRSCPTYCQSCRTDFLGATARSVASIVVSERRTDIEPRHGRRQWQRDDEEGTLAASRTRFSRSRAGPSERLPFVAFR